jgi:hypothetical protein
MEFIFFQAFIESVIENKPAYISGCFQSHQHPLIIAHHKPSFVISRLFKRSLGDGTDYFNILHFIENMCHHTRRRRISSAHL